MKKIILAFSLLTSLNLFAEDVNVKNIELKNDKNNENKLSIKIVGNLIDNPTMSVNDKILSITIPNSHVSGKIVRHALGTEIVASQIDRSTVVIKTTLPYSLKGKESQVNVTLIDGAVNVSFPKGITQSKISRSPSVVAEEVVKSEVVNKEAEKLDESFLNKLSDEQLKLQKAKEIAEKNIKEEKLATNDRVTMTQASVQKETTKISKEEVSTGKSNFSIAGYVGKFVAFLSLMILGFYGVLTMFKKGVIKKGKLGFLHSTKMVEVLSTTHVAPKRTLMMVKAHKQVFLIANHETGIQLISEINDVTGIIKTGEEEVAGNNFDTTLVTANRAEKEFKLKEDVIADDYTLDDMLNDSGELHTNASLAIEKAPVKDEVRFSDQIKTKLKNLKQL